MATEIQHKRKYEGVHYLQLPTLVQARKETGKSQRVVIEEASVSRALFMKWEKFERMPLREEAIKVANAIGMHPDDIRWYPNRFYEGNPDHQPDYEYIDAYVIAQREGNWDSGTGALRDTGGTLMKTERGRPFVITAEGKVLW